MYIKFFFIFFLFFLFSLNTNLAFTQQISLDQIQSNISNGANLFSENMGVNDFYSRDPNSGLFDQRKFIEQKSLTTEEKNLITNLITENYNTKTSLELDYSIRSKKDLKLQGYDFFLINYLNSRRNPILPTGYVDDEYVLGVGDDIKLIFEGRENQTLNKKVTSNGLIHLGFSDPINASGRKFGDVKKQIQYSVKIHDRNFGLYKLENVRPVNVTVIGEVNLPGVQTLTGMSSVMDVNYQRRYKRTGSLNIILIKMK